MKIRFLGTGAADWKIEKHRELEGFRRNASALIDGCLLIDPGPNVPDALQAFGIAPEGIRYILNTHRHGDHYAQGTVDFLQGAAFTPMAAGEELSLGRYHVRALKANHATCEEAVHFLISDGEKTLFYGLDGAWLLYEEWRAIQAAGADYAVLDATVGNGAGDYRIFEHNDLAMVLEMKQTLSPYVKRFCISHMARTLHESHEALTAQMAPLGVEVAYDGYETEI